MATVAKGDSGCLLGHCTARILGLYQTDQFRKTVSSINAVSDRYCDLMDRFPEVFNDNVGKLKDFEAHIHADKSAKPIQVPYRRLAYNLVKAVDRELDLMLEQGIIEEVHDPCKWVSAMCVVPKKRPGEVRITLDSRLVNRTAESMK
jgi:hypothetical protein